LSSTATATSNRDSIDDEANKKHPNGLSWRVAHRLAGQKVVLKQRGLKMQTLVVDLVLAAGVCAIFLIALRGGKDEKG
jgi:hypothetical protein